MQEKCCVIFNPAAQGEKAGRFRRFLDQVAGFELLPTTYPGAARNLANEAVRRGFRTIVAAGGDGTMHEVVNGIGDAPDGLEKARLGILPLGTVNVAAKEMRIPGNPKRAWPVILRGKTVTIDLPEATFQVTDGAQHRFFIQMAGAGLDARAVELVSWDSKKKLGSRAYVLAGLKALSGPQPFIEATGASRTASGQLIIVSNGKYYAGRFAICPRAEYADGLLDVCVIPKVDWIHLPLTALALVAGRFKENGMASHFQAEEIQLTSTARVPLQLDGEAVGCLPAKIRMQPRKLRVIVP